MCISLSIGNTLWIRLLRNGEKAMKARLWCTTAMALKKGPVVESSYRQSG
jgi:hypothetical protein